GNPSVIPNPAAADIGRYRRNTRDRWRGRRRPSRLGAAVVRTRRSGGATMICLDHVCFYYSDSAHPALDDINLSIEEAEMVLLSGRTGSGKSTLLEAMNGLVPHFTGGTLAGDVSVDGLSTRNHPPRDLAGRIGFVGQDPAAGFVTDTVEEELAYG